MLDHEHKRVYLALLYINHGLHFLSILNIADHIRVGRGRHQNSVKY
jgi:hypothetical protein